MEGAFERDYGWFGALMAEHYAGDDTQRADAGWRASSPPTPGSASRTSRRRSDAFLRTRAASDASAAAIWSARTRRWSSCSATWRRTGSRTTSPQAAAATSCGRSARTCTASPASGSSAAHALAYTSDDRGGTITHKPEADYLDDGPQKPIRIWSRTGRRPLLAAGNSNGDMPMLEFTQHADKPTLRLLVLHDDAEREFDYTTGAEQALERAGDDGWTVVSIKNDWATSSDRSPAGRRRARAFGRISNDARDLGLSSA